MSRRTKAKSRFPEVDPGFIRKVRPLFTALERYFRYEVKGIKNIPSGKSLIVMNHGVIPYHGFLLAKAIIDDLKIHPRGLGADFLFEIPGVREFFLKGGAVKASPQNAERLLRQKHIVMLAPGGIYEALLAKQGLRRIPWERRKGFVRLAVKTNTPIVPTYCRGINSVYFNSYLLLKERIRLLRKTRFSLPLFFGLGILPFPRKLVHRIGKPIDVSPRKRETRAHQIERVHKAVLKEMRMLAQKKP